VAPVIEPLEPIAKREHMPIVGSNGQNSGNRRSPAGSEKLANLSPELQPYSACHVRTNFKGVILSLSLLGSLVREGWFGPPMQGLWVQVP
jgi:hypothetical protein